MAEDRNEKIAEGQRKTTYVIDGSEWPRVRYGEEAEDWGANERPCHDCGVIKGQYHVPFVCDAERCPACDGQAIGCDCNYEGDEEP